MNIKLKRLWDIAFYSLLLGSGLGIAIGWSAHEIWILKIQPVQQAAQVASDPVGAFQRWLGGQKQ